MPALYEKQKQDTRENETNQLRAEKLHTMLNEVLIQVMTPGFHGNLSVVCRVQDGILQSLRSSVEKTVR